MVVVSALQRFSSRANSFQSRPPELLRFRKQHSRQMSEPTDISRVKSESAVSDKDHAFDSDATGDRANDSATLNTPPLQGGISPLLSSSSPPHLSRNASFAGSSSYQEDWEVFPPLDKLTVFDLLDNLALPQRLEKWQTTLNVQKEKVKRHQQKLKSTGLNAKDRVVEEWRRRLPTPDEQLDKYKRRMRDSVDRLGTRWNDTKAVTLREKLSFIAGVLNIFISGYLIGAHPERFYWWFTLQLAYFMPIRWYTYQKRGYHYFLADLCYFVNLLLLLSVWVFPQSKRLFISTYCLAYGNNAVAIAMWRNSMVFHSLDKVTSLFIHIMPPVTLHCIVHLTDPEFQRANFPAIYNIRFSPATSSEHYSLWSMMIWATVPYAVWQLSYHFLITVRRREKIAAGRPTSFTWLRKSYSKAMIGRVVLSLPESLQEPAFMMVQYVYALGTMVPCPIWFWYRWPSACFLMAVFIWSIYNGATFYIDVFGKRFQNELEQLKKDVSKWQSTPEGVSPTIMAKEVDGMATPQPRTLSLGAAEIPEGEPLMESHEGSTGLEAPGIDPPKDEKAR
ncbi:hypothetical protein MMC32_007069 [Xylographa parallela]|nr:hypothetical protein [Xylographa parallela]